MGTEVAVNQESAVNTRRWQRYKLDVPVRVIIRRPDRVKVIDGRGSELNAGGLAIAAGVELMEGDIIDVEFTPPYSAEPVRVSGEVRDRDGYTYGLQFLTADPDDRERVEVIRAALAAMGRPIV